MSSGGICNPITPQTNASSAARFSRDVERIALAAAMSLPVCQRRWSVRPAADVKVRPSYGQHGHPSRLGTPNRLKPRGASIHVMEETDPESTDGEYLQIMLDVIRTSTRHKPKFGKGNRHGLTLEQFCELYRQDTVYSWLGLDTSQMYTLHKAAGSRFLPQSQVSGNLGF